MENYIHVVFYKFFLQMHDFFFLYTALFVANILKHFLISPCRSGI